MKPLAPTILANSKKALALLNDLETRLHQLGGNGGLHAESCVSNGRLLLERLVEFYEDANNAAYFPHAADHELSTPLTSLAQSLEQLKSSNAPQHAHAAVAAADQLYAVAMRLGLVSFGLGPNELKALWEEAGAKRKLVKRIAAKVEDQAADVDKTALEIIEKAQAAQAAAAEALRAGEGIEGLRTKIAELVAANEAEQQRAKQASEDASKIANESEEAKEASLQAADSSLAASGESKASAKAASDAAKTAQADLDAIQQMKANAKEEMESVVEFYGEIEQHQKAMLEARKEAEAKFNALNKEHLDLQAGYQAQTEKIVAENVALQAQIKLHLQRAVGATLFHAFDKRRTGLNFGKWVWAGVMLAAVVAGGGLSLWLAESLKGGSGNGLEPAFFVKLSAIIPVTFAIVFAAKQYANERRTEEEYAFKSAISLSLEPYKDLLQKMKTDGHEAQAAFVEKLLLEIFDNPVSRVYSDADGKRAKIEKAMTLKDVKGIISVSKDLDVEKVKQVMEILGGNLPKP